MDAHNHPPLKEYSLNEREQSLTKNSASRAEVRGCLTKGGQSQGYLSWRQISVVTSEQDAKPPKSRGIALPFAKVASTARSIRSAALIKLESLCRSPSQRNINEPDKIVARGLAIF
jgi:hypothetical protein